MPMGIVYVKDGKIYYRFLRLAGERPRDYRRRQDR